MAQSTYMQYPPELSDSQRDYLLTNLKDWSIAKGLAIRPASPFVSAEQDSGLSLAITAPVTLFPSLFPRACFDEALAIQPIYNKLYSAIARDVTWLQPIIEKLLDIDSFVADLWKVHIAVAREGYAQNLSLGLFRSDYMVHFDQTTISSQPEIKQVEFNTIASSFGGLSSKVSELHQHLQSIDAYPSSAVRNDQLVQSKSIPLLAEGLSAAHKAYGSSTNGFPLCVIFLVQDSEHNVFDQRHLQYALSETHGVRVFRLPFQRVLADTRVAIDRTLLYHPPNVSNTPYEVTTVYFRAGYSPDEYKSSHDWSARLQIERSRAIKCPSILTQLAGCKKIQQVLATPHSLDLAHFLADEIEADQVRRTFAPIYPMDLSEVGKEARKLAMNPDTSGQYVLKPQREGGGNNIYRKKIPAFLKNTPESHWPAHILMEMIEPPPQKNVILRNGKLHKGGVICELGVYGVCLWRNENVGVKEEILENWEAGYLLRTKGDDSEEGGVAAGFGAVDSCCLIDI